MGRTRKDAIIIILICNAVLISLLESVVPIPLPIPGVKLGLANIITIIAIAFLDFKDVIVIVFIRCIVAAVLSKGITALPFSMLGGLMSAAVMWVCYWRLAKLFSVSGISILGAITHNMAQILVASLIIRESVLMYYLPVLMVSAIVTGMITGFISDLTIRKIKTRDIFTETLCHRDMDML